MKIEDYGLIGDTHTAALVGRNGSIDWLCLPRFDSAACFSALLGDENHGYWKMAPAGKITATSRRYRPGTLILETDFETEEGCVRVIDFMPPRDHAIDLVRVVRGIRGRVKMKMQLVIRFDYGSILPWVRQIDDRLEAVAGPDAISLWCDVPTRGEDLTTVAEFEISEGDTQTFLLLWHPSYEAPKTHVEPLRELKKTERWWREWSSQSKQSSEWDEAVQRSLITLKALTYAPSGGIIAAPTTSLPEKIGGVRNWDYRYCWLRDATFTLYSLLAAGYKSEACAWRDWLLRAVAGDPSKLQIMYGARGERRLDEYEVPWLPGYENSKPVHVGNAASGQFQLDVYGELIDVMHQSYLAGIEPEEASWRMQRAVMEFLETAWHEPDEGIWEVRGPRRHFTHSKVMAWVAFDRAVCNVEKFGLVGPVDRWRQQRDQLREEICARGFSKKLGSFTQDYGSEKLDASLLMLPLVGFLPPEDERIRGTVAAIERDLVVDGFVMRYHPDKAEDVDGLPPGEGAFLPCSFWLADNYILLGRRDEARELFERLLSLRNDLGLLSEEYDPRAKRLVGNFPQAFSHIALINTAHNLSKPTGPAHQRRKSVRDPKGQGGAETL